MIRGTEARITDLLASANAAGGFPASLVCTAEGLTIAASGTLATDNVAAFASLFEDIVVRGRRDLGLQHIDEVSLRGPIDGRYVVRPLVFAGRTRAFVVVCVPAARSWRRITNALVSRLSVVLSPLMQEDP
ncbi:MAG TPA: hypothetical protein ENK18_06260 [Deltaproteobacteria bacterium]|nr:hypothetical protein [Deltaproteobacteria bacterium]